MGNTMAENMNGLGSKTKYEYPMAKARDEVKSMFDFFGYTDPTPEYQKSPSKQISNADPLDNILPPLSRILEKFNSELFINNMGMATLRPPVSSTSPSSGFDGQLGYTTKTARQGDGPPNAVAAALGRNVAASDAAPVVAPDAAPVAVERSEIGRASCRERV